MTYLPTRLRIGTWQHFPMSDDHTTETHEVIAVSDTVVSLRTPMTATENAAHSVATALAFNADMTHSLRGLSAAMRAACEATAAFLSVVPRPTLRWNPHQKRWGMVRRG